MVFCRNLILVVFITFFLSKGVQGQWYTYDTSNVKIKVVDFFNTDSVGRIDTTLTGVHRYNSKVYDESYLFLGTYGSNSGYKLHCDSLEIGLVGLLENRQSLLTPSELVYFQVTKPFTRVTYYNGPKTEQEIIFDHTQNVSKNLNIGVRFRRFSTEGFYQNQRNVFSNSGISFNYKSDDKRYLLRGYGIINIGLIEENGGIIYDSVFTENTESNRLGIGTYLSDASNKYDSRFYGLEQRYVLLNKGDSNSSKLEYAVGLNTSYSLEDLRYEDTNPVDSFYSEYGYVVPSYVSDKLQRRVLSNELGMLLDYRNSFHIEFTGINRLYKFYNQLSDTVFLDWGVGARTRMRLGDIDLSAGINYMFLGYTEGNYRITARASKAVLSGTGKITGYLNNSRKVVGWEYTMYENDVEQWRNNFDDIVQTEVGLQFTVQDQPLFETRLTQIRNYTYYSSKLTPTQYGDQLTLVKSSIGYTLEKLAPLYVEIGLTYSKLLTDQAPINLPEVQTRSTIYVEKPFFKKALQGRIGFDVYYFTAFKGDGYMPLGRRYYYQTQTETGGFVYVDAFLSLEIGRARGFVKMSNITAGWLTPYNYVLVPGYPLQDNGLRFGISWDLMN